MNFLRSHKSYFLKPHALRHHTYTHRDIHTLIRVWFLLSNSDLLKMNFNLKLHYVIYAFISYVKPWPSGLWSKAGGRLMTMESISLSDSMCLHFRLAMVLTSSFNGNHWVVWLCSICVHVCMSVCMVLQKTSPILTSWLKTTLRFHFSLCPLYFLGSHFPLTATSHCSSITSFTETSKFIYPWKFKKFFLLFGFSNNLH